MPRWTLLFAVLLTVTTCPAQGRAGYGVRTDGRTVTSLAPVGTKAVVLFFVASDCPISNRTFPEMKRLQAMFAHRDVRFWFVYPNAGERAAEVQKHQAAYDADGEAMLDVSGRLVAMTGARVTPEIAVLVPGSDPTAHGSDDWRVVYTGRVDDRYLRIGQERPQATEHFGQRVLAEVLDGRKVEAATGAPVGCAIIGHEKSSGR